MTSDSISSESQIDTTPPAAGAQSAAERGLEELPRGLTRAQAGVLQALVAGSSITDAARDTGVSRMTIYRWQKSDPRFSALLNAWRRQTLDSARDQLVALSETAVGAVQSAVASGDGRLGLQVLRLLGTQRGARGGSDNPAEVLRRLEQQRTAHRIKMSETSLFAGSPESRAALARLAEEESESHNG